MTGRRLRLGVVLRPQPSAWAALAVRQLGELADVVRLQDDDRAPTAAAATLARLVDRILTGETSTASGPAPATAWPAPDDGRELDLVVDMAGDGTHAPDRGAHGTLVLGIDGRRGHELTACRVGCVRRSLELRRPDGTWAFAGEAVQRRDAVSRARTLDAALWSSPGLLRAAIARLAREDTLEAPPPMRSSVPTNLPLPVEVLRHAWRRSTLAADRERWHLVVRRPAPTAFEPVSAAEAAAALAPSGRIWADPFLTVLEGREHVLFEDASVGGRGRIAMAAVGADGRLGPARTVLERPYHLSYPFLTRRDDRTFLVPESGENRTVDLYELVDSPPRAVLRANLLEGLTALDPTIVEAGGRLRLFVFVVTDGRTAGELRLFSADALEGPWEPHPRNPVGTDARTARPAGGFLRVDGRLLRPAQSAIPRHGAHMTLQEVLHVSDEDYAERPFASLRGPGSLGQHHLDRLGDIEVLDVLRRDPLLRRPHRRRS
jgi:hypothetical protein